MDAHQHESFVKTPKQLVVVILLAFLVPVIGILLLVQLVLTVAGPDPRAMAPEAVAERIKPVARVEFGPREGAPAPAQTAAAKPKLVAFARFAISSMSLNFSTLSTGPNISSVAIRMSSVTPANSVGSM